MRYGSKDSVRNVKVTGTLRKPQIITTFGSGSMVDMAEYSVIMASTDYWTKSNRIYEPNLQRLLGVNYFQEPKSNFQIAFNMFDTDGNERVDKKEFLVVNLLNLF